MVRASLTLTLALLLGCASAPEPAPEPTIPMPQETPEVAQPEIILSPTGEKMDPAWENWSDEKLAEWLARWEELMAKGRYSQVYTEAFYAAHQLVEPFRPLRRGMRREHYIAVLEIAGRAGEFMDSNQVIGKVYGNLVTQFESMDYEDNRTRLRLLTGKAYNHLVHGGVAPASSTIHEAVELLEKTPDATPLERGRTLYVLGWSLSHGSPEKAASSLAHLESGWTLIDGAVPPNHPERIRPLHLLIHSHLGGGRYADGLPYARQLHALLTRGGREGPPFARQLDPHLARVGHDGPREERIGWLELSMGAALAETGKRKEATRTTATAVARLRSRYEPDRREPLATALDVASHNHLRNRDVKRAAAASDEAMKIMEDPAIGLYASSEVAILAGMARVRRAQRKKKEALALFQRAALTATLKARETPRDIAYTQCYLYLYLKEIGRKAEARKRKESALRQVDEAFPKGHRVHRACHAGKFDGY
jgi:hypothetical protein